VKPLAYFFLGMPFGAFLMWLWVQSLLHGAKKALEEATQAYARAEETFRKIRDVINTPEVPR
jgi:hypothetical protein